MSSDNRVYGHAKCLATGHGDRVLLMYMSIHATAEVSAVLQTLRLRN